MTNERMKKCIRLSVIALAYLSLSIGVYWSLRSGVTEVHAQQSVETKPFVAELWLISFVEVPSGRVEEKRQVRQRQDGALSEKVLSRTAGPGHTPTRKLTLPDGRVIVINDRDKIRTTKKMSTTELAQLKESAKSAQNGATCGQPHWVPAGEETVAGIKTQVWIYESMSDDRQVVARTTFHRAPTLGCADLKTVQDERRLGEQYRRKWENTAQWVNESAPPSTEMDPANSYAELSPSSFWRRTDRATALIFEAMEKKYCDNNPCSDQQKSLMQKAVDNLSAADRSYASQRVR